MARQAGFLALSAYFICMSAGVKADFDPWKKWKLKSQCPPGQVHCNKADALLT